MPSTPASASTVFTVDRLAVATDYVELLATDGVVRGLIGPREAPRLWSRHVLNCAVIADEIPPDSSVCDIGSGAGLPGLVLAIARPDAQVTLVEPLLRRTTFLEEAVGHLGLDNVEVVRGRAEALHGRRTFDVVTSRAVAPLERLLGWSMPLVEAQGSLIAMKGQSVLGEIDAAADFLRTWSCAVPVVTEVGEGVVDPQTTIVRVAWADPARVGWPLARSSGRRRPPARKRVR